MKRLIIFSLFFISQFYTWAQTNNVGIGTTTPDESAALDITSDDKGMLTPRMSTLARESILAPADGLLVFDTNTNSFWYNTGNTWIEINSYERSWNEKIEKQLVNNLIRPDSVVRDYQFAASISIDGDRAIFGVLDDRNLFTEAKGEAHIYSYDGTEWIPEAILEASDGGEQRKFGISVDIEGDYAVVGSQIDNSLALSAGSAYVYKYDGSSWVEQAKLEPSDIAAGYEFGSTVKIDGDYIAVSAMGARNSGIRSGAVYIFHRSGTNWIEEAKVFDSAITNLEQYGHSIDLEGDRLAVCHLFDTIATNHFGSIHVYERSGANWTEQQKVTYPSTEAISYFGRSVTLSYPYMSSRIAHGSNGQNLFGNVVVHEHSASTYSQSYIVEEPYDIKDKFSFGFFIDMDANHMLIGSNTAAQLYSKLGTEWIHQMELTFPNMKTDSQLGHPCALEGDHIIIGEPKNSDIFIDNGAAYYINRNEPLCDKDIDPTNEIETWSTLQGIPPDLLDGDDGDDLGNHMATQDLDMGNQKISNLNNPILDGDAAPKSYVDDGLIPLQSGIDNNTSDILTNTVNINNNGASIFNNTLAINTHTTDDMDLNPTNELQTLSISGQEITLSSGNTISLPDDTGVFETNMDVIQYTGPNDHDFILGLDSLPMNGVPYTEFGLLYDGVRAAIRCGTSYNSFSWTSGEIGSYSAGFGNSTLASGSGSAAFGGFTEASGVYSLATNSETQATAFASTAMGRWTDATGDISLSTGIFTKAEAYASAAFGRYNVGTGNSSTWVSTDPLFEVGNGADHLNKRNALTILKNGTVSFENYTFPNMDGTTDQILATDGSGNISWTDETQVVFENNAGVVRNAGSNSDDFVFGAMGLPQNSNIATGEVFFFDNSKAAFRAGGLNNSMNWSTDSIGSYSAAFGLNTLASGSYSFATGHGSKATGDFSVAMGRSNVASGSNSIALGDTNSATGENSLATGFTTIASGNNSTAMGNFTEAIGNNSTAMGLFTNANGINSTAMGSYLNANGTNSFALGHGLGADAYGVVVIGRGNVGGGNSAVWVSEDPIFEIGIGNYPILGTEKNAFTVYKNGIAEFSDSLHTGGNLNVGTGIGSRIYLGNTMMQSGGPSLLRVDANIRPFEDDMFDLGSSGKRWQDVWATNGVIQTSDRRLKKNISKLYYGLEEVLELQPVQYNWKKEKEEDKLHVGLIAQDLLQIIPEVVSEEGEYLGVKYAELVPVLISAIQEQQEIINSQKNKISSLENDILTSNENIETIINRLNQVEKNLMNE